MFYQEIVGTARQPPPLSRVEGLSPGEALVVWRETKESSIGALQERWLGNYPPT